MRGLRPLHPKHGKATRIETGTGVVALATIGSNVWSDLTPVGANFVLGVDINVPRDERWLCNVHGSYWVQGPNPPTYMIMTGAMFSGAMTWAPVSDSSSDVLKSVIDITTANDSKWGTFAGQIWLPPGVTKVRMVHAMNSGAFNFQRRELSVIPHLAMAA